MLNRPSGPLAFGTGDVEAVQALIEEVKDGSYWRRAVSVPVDTASYELTIRRDADRLRHVTSDLSAELETVRSRIYELPISQVRRIPGRVDPARWRCPPVARW